MKYYLFTFFIVSVTVAIGSTIAVFAIRAISVLSGFDVYIIDDGAQVGQLLMVSQFVDEQIACFGCITGTAYVNTHVCHARNQLGVGHHTDGSGIEYHIVEFLFNRSTACTSESRATSSVGLGGMAPPGRMYRLGVTLDCCSNDIRSVCSGSAR